MKKHELNVIFTIASGAVGLGALFLGAPTIMWAIPLIGSTVAIGDICIEEIKAMRRARRERLKL